MRLIFVSLLALSASACVTETHIAGTNKPVITHETNATEAARTRIALGLRYLRNGDTSQAKYNLERAKKHAPKLGEVYYALAYYYQTVGELELAETAYEDALDYAPHDGSTMNNYGAFLCRGGRYQEAERLFLAAIQEPSYIRVADAYENAGLCSLKAKQFIKAKTYSQKALSYNANRSGALITLAEANLEMADVRAASYYLKQYLNRYPMDADSAVLGYKIAYAQGSPMDQEHYAEILKTRFPAAYAGTVVRPTQE